MINRLFCYFHGGRSNPAAAYMAMCMRHLDHKFLGNVQNTPPPLPEHFVSSSLSLPVSAVLNYKTTL